ncbi:hypothetical protein HanRHA438_Chr02g0095711 [Helianthus annuus]|nr:hypothetical protein HanRHA438_Chr02g0095711 [Helianthus annuus]
MNLHQSMPLIQNSRFFLSVHRAKVQALRLLALLFAHRIFLSVVICPFAVLHYM